ncbi:SpoIIE family protein phosphatase [Victivallis sp. Marseille-Q1083]|uniref:SpoIIE family protein phosphatase n=1 Tax=Victivallis sp. Marseille-Q1083 TaxID=2717288 RepID=UPI00158A274B|nr:SpoIIE family protein phosphatase [Victivallis sp. Marseille-Q1083]
MPEYNNLFIDMGYSQCCCHGELICGDAIKFKRLPAEDRFIAVLSDGLGHGVKANILASMTTTMALKFIAEELEIIHSAEIIMDALPVCQVRKISYSTFTIVDTRLNGETRVIEMGNPEFLLLRNGAQLRVPFEELNSPKYENRTMRSYHFQGQPHDRLIFFSDGITQAGLGTPNYPLGWRLDGCLGYTQELIRQKPDLSAHDLSGAILREAVAKEAQLLPLDDMTCAVIYFRPPRKLMLFTGPPYHREHDHACAELLKNFDGAKVICGGTSATIISREWQQEMTMDLATVGRDLPPISIMAGVDLITEGIFTLTRTAQYLEKDGSRQHNDPAGRLMDLLLNNDIIEFVVGTRINEAHQDPNLPIDLEFRRNIVRRIANALRDKYMKEVNIRFV